MRSNVLGIALVLGLGAGAHAAAVPRGAAGAAALGQDWERCVRDVYDGQPAHQSRAASQLTALDACKAREDAYVAALLAQQADEDAQARREGHSFASRARAWAASVAAYVIDPLLAWRGAPVP